MTQRQRAPGGGYTDDLYREALARGWHLLDPEIPRALPESGAAASPGFLLEGCLDEPVVLTRDAGGAEHLLSNACTHRGALVASGAGACKKLRCPYHGRRFSLGGAFEAAPGFGEDPAVGSPQDDLPAVPSGRLGPLRFASVQPACTLDALLGPVLERVGFLPLDRLLEVPELHRDYAVRAHWALYCDNYLEGLHIPFVHPALNQSLELGAYQTEVLPWGALQVGVAGEGTPAMTPPAGHPDHGKRVAAWYFWLFPTTMINVYPWGISANAVQPLGPRHTRVRFSTWTWEAPDSPALADLGKHVGGIHTTEMEDERVVELVQRGVSSRLYRGGRYAPGWEDGLRHFHTLLERVGGLSG